ncbi:MAG: phage protease [Thermodesulfovibrionales bacterium]|nr:phage protease [Thermodesulfovibrionales bacterium]
MDRAGIQVLTAIDGAPSEIQVIPFGAHHTDKGDFVLDEESAEAVVNDFNSRQNDMVIDYEHQTLSGQEAPAAGWIKRLTFYPPSSPLAKGGKEGGGIWAAVQWTERARDYLSGREYRYLSPVFLKRLADNRVVRLINAALTNQPAIDGMVPLVNKGSVTPESSGGVPPGKEVRVMKRLLVMLGLPDDAGEDEAVSALEAVMSGFSEFRARVASAIGLSEGAALSEVAGTIMAMKQAEGRMSEIPELMGRISELKSRLAKKDACELVSAAMKQGKVTPAQREWAASYAETDPEGFKVFVSKAPEAVPMGEAAAAGASVPYAVDEMQAHVNSLLMVDEGIFRKHNKKEG